MSAEKEWGRKELEAALPGMPWARDQHDSLRARAGFMVWEWLRGETSTNEPGAHLRLYLDRADDAPHEEEAFGIERWVQDLKDVEKHVPAMLAAARAYVNALGRGKYVPRPFGQLHPITLPFPHGNISYGPGDLGIAHYKTGAPTLFLVSSAPDDQRGWYSWARDQRGLYWGMGTHVSNSLLDENPWLAEWMYANKILVQPARAEGVEG